MSEFVISLKQKYLDLMLAKEKSIELRRRPMHQLTKDSRVWIYGSLPVGAIKAVATVKQVLHLPPDVAWERYSAHIAISESEYMAYVEDSDQVSLVVWDEIQPLVQEFSLSDIRKSIPGFRPPQFYSQFSPPRGLKRIAG